MAVLEDRNAFIEEASPLVRKTKSALLRDGLIERLSTAVGYKNSDELRKYFGFPVLPPALLRELTALVISVTDSAGAMTATNSRGFRRRPGAAFLRKLMLL